MEYNKPYLGKLGIQGIRDTRGNLWETRGFSKIQPIRRGTNQNLEYFLLSYCVERNLEVWYCREGLGTDIGDVNIGGGGFGDRYRDVHIMGVGEIWDRHEDVNIVGGMVPWVEIGDVNIVRRWGFGGKD